MSVDTNSLVPNGELRSEAREILRGNYGGPIAVLIVYSLVMGISSCVVWLIAGAMSVGSAAYFIAVVKREEADFALLFSGFNAFVQAFIAWLLMTVYVTLWSLLLFIPGIVAALGYSQVFYILADEPELSAKAALNKSREMMQGNKGKLFMLGLEYLPAFLLVGLTLGIAGFWVLPRVQVAMALFYRDLKANYSEQRY